MYRLHILAIAILLLIISCAQNSGSDGKVVQEIRTEGFSNADIIRNPISADEPTDTVNIAKILFEETDHDFGTVREGDIVEHTFRFRNTGKVPLVITEAKSTCGCTVPEWPKDPIPPGENGSISVKFNTSNKEKRQEKPVTITANTLPKYSRVYLRGYVEPEAD